jgi:hypothetical protein
LWHGVKVRNAFFCAGGIKLCNSKFAWQDSAAAFSVLKSDVNCVCKYILNQPNHHLKTTFAEEYDEFIKFYQKTLQPFEKLHLK